MSDRELLELAAKAAGIEIKRSRLDDPACNDILVSGSARNPQQEFGPWNPLTDDGDALRLLAALRIPIAWDDELLSVSADGHAENGWALDRCESVRRAITRAAAVIGAQIK